MSQFITLQMYTYLGWRGCVTFWFEGWVQEDIGEKVWVRTHTYVAVSKFKLNSALWTCCWLCCPSERAKEAITTSCSNWQQISLPKLFVWDRLIHRVLWWLQPKFVLTVVNFPSNRKYLVRQAKMNVRFSAGFEGHCSRNKAFLECANYRINYVVELEAYFLK